MTDKYPTQERLLELFRYDPISGNLFWRVRMANCIQIGDVAGTMLRGYIVVRVDGKAYKAHRVIWCMVYGYWPSITDHINSVRYDNRLENLREVTQSENCKNRIGLKITQEMIDFVINSPLSARQAALQIGMSPRYASSLRKGEYRA